MLAKFNLDIFRKCITDAKPQDAVNAEDLETLQRELEQSLVDAVTQKWDLERELQALSTTSPDASGKAPTPTPNSTTAPSGTTSGKVKSKLGHIESSENASDGFKSSLFNNNNNGVPGSASGTNSTEDSVSSEGSLVSSVTGSTIILANLQDSGSQPTNSNSAVGSKRGHKGRDDRPSKRFRQNSSTNSLSSATTGYTKRPPHSKHRSKIISSKFRNPAEESRPLKKQLYKNEAPDKLWPFVEQFCATPTEEQVSELEEMIKSMDNDREYFRVPPLGKRESSTKDSPSKSSDNGSKKKTKARTGDEEAGLGALSQRLVSTFIEESEDVSSDLPTPKNGDCQPNKKKNSKTRGNKSIDMNNAKNLEKTIRQELEEHRILEQQDDIPYTSEEDEILRDLVTCQHELLSIHRQNKESMKVLLKRAKKHMELEREREKLKEASSEVVAAYHRLIQAKQKKRNPTKKEKDAAWVALKLQEAIFRRCDDLYMSSLSRDGNN